MFPLKSTLIGLVFLPALARAQAGGLWSAVYERTNEAASVASGTSAFQVGRPDIIVQVSRHRMDADMFEITAVQPNYPADLLRGQVEKLCEILGVPPRGLIVGKATIGGDPKLASTKASFATNGVIDPKAGVLRIEPIVKAFAGVPPPMTVDGITILFNGVTATPAMLQSLTTPALRIQSVSNVDPPVVEYRVQLLSQDPALIEIPDSQPPEQNGPTGASTVQRKGVDWTLWVSLLAAAVAAGVLVYFLMLRTPAKPRR